MKRKRELEEPYIVHYKTKVISPGPLNGSETKSRAIFGDQKDCFSFVNSLYENDVFKIGSLTKQVVPGTAWIEDPDGNIVKSKRTKRATLSVKEIRREIRYNPDTGEMFWTNGTRRKRKVKMHNKLGYPHFWFLGAIRIASRVAWAHYHGELPTGPIFMLNGNREDIRISNMSLRYGKQRKAA